MDGFQPNLLQRVGNFFKSASRKRMERELAVRRAVTVLRKQIVTLKENEAGYLKKAQEAIRLGSEQQIQFLKKTLAKTLAQRRLLERELLQIQTMQQLDGQMRSHTEFVGALNAMGEGLAEMFREVDVATLQTRLQKAMLRAEGASQQVDYMLDVLSETMFALDDNYTNQLVSDDEIERLLAGNPAVEPVSAPKLAAGAANASAAPAAADAVDGKIVQLIRDIERELHHEK